MVKRGRGRPRKKGKMPKPTQSVEGALPQLIQLLQERIEDLEEDNNKASGRWPVWSKLFEQNRSATLRLSLSFIPPKIIEGVVTLSKIASCLDKPLFVDEYSVQQRWVSYARVLVVQTKAANRVLEYVRTGGGTIEIGLDPIPTEAKASLIALRRPPHHVAKHDTLERVITSIQHEDSQGSYICFIQLGTPKEGV
ncbi:hypothetical protein HAX54_045571 [Datura stramonium]|uniref:Uncharacterized protein n=1 Tax=Datura stramonium TaxID=4076 RepID=A0ABS8SQF0_DATST|nr:hypothetical protein [Datura stramonium]